MFGLSNPIKLLLVVAAGYFLYKMFSNDKKFKKKATGGQSAEAVGDDMVKDPICGSYVSREGSIRVRNGDQVMCFCSYDCRDKYVKRLQSGAAQAEQVQSNNTTAS